MSNRGKTHIQVSSLVNPATFTISPPILDVGNVRVIEMALPHHFSQVRSTVNDHLSITMVAQSTVSIVVPPANFQNRQIMADIITCEYDKSKTGWPESVVAGYDSARNRFIVKTIKFDPSDIDEEDPLPGDELITIDNSFPGVNIAYRLMGFLPATNTVAATVHTSTYRDLFYKRHYLYVRSTELSALMVNDTRLEADNTDTPPIGKPRCIWLIPIDQQGTTGRIINRFVSDHQVFYNNLVSRTNYNISSFDIDITYEDGTSVDFEMNITDGDPQYNKWAMMLRFDKVDPVAG